MEECKEWDAFPEAFWNETHILQYQADPSKLEVFPLEGKFSSKLTYIVHEIQRVIKIEDKCVKDYQYSGYIDHQPVAIDFLDYLIDIYGELYDAAANFNKILHDSSIQLSIHQIKEN